MNIVVTLFALWLGQWVLSVAYLAHKDDDIKKSDIKGWVVTDTATAGDEADLLIPEERIGWMYEVGDIGFVSEQEYTRLQSLLGRLFPLYFPHKVAPVGFTTTQVEKGDVIGEDICIDDVYLDIEERRNVEFDLDAEGGAE